MPQRRKRIKDKRIKIDVWVGASLRAAIGAIMREDGKPATDAQIRDWAQGQIDERSVDEVAKFEAHGKGSKQRRGQ